MLNISMSLLDVDMSKVCVLENRMHVDGKINNIQLSEEHRLYF